MSRAVIALGTNMGDRHHHIDLALELLEERVGPVVSVSSRHETEPVLHPETPTPLWGVAAVVAVLTAGTTLALWPWGPSPVVALRGDLRRSLLSPGLRWLHALLSLTLTSSFLLGFALVALALGLEPGGVVFTAVPLLASRLLSVFPTTMLPSALDRHIQGYKQEMAQATLAGQTVKMQTIKKQWSTDKRDAIWGGFQTGYLCFVYRAVWLTC